MVGIIITGHGGYAAGMASALEFICGGQPLCEYVDFFGDEALYHREIAAALERLAGCTQLLTFCDLKGGTPFKYMAALSLSTPGLAVAYGLGLPAVIEAAGLREEQETPDAAALIGEVFGSLGIQAGVFSPPAASFEDDE